MVPPVFGISLNISRHFPRHGFPNIHFTLRRVHSPPVNERNQPRDQLRGIVPREENVKVSAETLAERKVKHPRSPQVFYVLRTLRRLEGGDVRDREECVRDPQQGNAKVNGVHVQLCQKYYQGRLVDPALPPSCQRARAAHHAQGGSQADQVEPEEQPEAEVVPLPDARVEERAVVVERRDAPAVDPAVVRAEGGTHDPTRLALLPVSVRIESSVPRLPLGARTFFVRADRRVLVDRRVLARHGDCLPREETRIASLKVEEGNDEDGRETRQFREDCNADRVVEVSVIFARRRARVSFGRVGKSSIVRFLRPRGARALRLWPMRCSGRY